MLWGIGKGGSGYSPEESGIGEIREENKKDLGPLFIGWASVLGGVTYVAFQLKFTPLLPRPLFSWKAFLEFLPQSPVTALAPASDSSPGVLGFGTDETG